MKCAKFGVKSPNQVIIYSLVLKFWKILNYAVFIYEWTINFSWRNPTAFSSWQKYKVTLLYSISMSISIISWSDFPFKNKILFKRFLKADESIMPILFNLK